MHSAMGALKQLAASLTRAGESVAIAETSAGGLIAAELLAQSGASKFFRGGVVVYSKHSKQAVLGLDPDSSQPTSTEPHALELAAAVREKLGSDWGVGETGVAGPSANSRGIAPGVCAIGVVGPDGVSVSTTLWPSDDLSAADAYGQPAAVPRDQAMRNFADAGVGLLCAAVAQREGGEPPATKL